MCIRDRSKAYELISEGKTLGVLLEYPFSENQISERTIDLTPMAFTSYPHSKPCLGFIGAGNYASSVLVPAFSGTGARLKSIASATGVSSVHVGRKNRIEQATTASDSLLVDEDINALIITTRHNSHAAWVKRGLKAGKHIFVEKPLALNRSELEELSQLYTALDKPPVLMVGFNRRYSPLIESLSQALKRKSQPV